MTDSPEIITALDTATGMVDSFDVLPHATVHLVLEGTKKLQDPDGLETVCPDANVDSCMRKGDLDAIFAAKIDVISKNPAVVSRLSPERRPSCPSRTVLTEFEDKGPTCGWRDGMSLPYVLH